MKRIVFRIVLLVIVAASAWGIDALSGQINDLSVIREHARQFRAEAAPLETSTLALVPKIQHRYVDDVPTADSNALYRWLRTDENGLIINPTSRFEGGVKILFLGGSTTETNEVAEHLRFPTIVEARVNEAGFAASVMNGGVRGNTTQDSINSLLNRPGFRDANVVVLMENINDRLRLALRDSYSSRLIDFAPTSGAAVWQAFKSFGRLARDWFVYRSNLLFLLDHYLSSYNPFVGSGGILVNEKSIDFQDGDTAQHARLYRQNLEIFVTLVRALGAEPVLMTQALSIPSSQQKMFNDVMRQVAVAESVQLIDLDAYLGQSATWAFFEDKIHLNNAGSEAVGEFIAKSILATKPFGTPQKANGSNDLSFQARQFIEQCLSGNTFSNSNPVITKLLPISGRYPSFSLNGRYLLFQTFEKGFEAIRALDFDTGRILNITPANQIEDERHPVFLETAGDDIRVLFGAGARSTNLETLKIREWPSGTTQKLEIGGLGGAIPAVSGKSIVFPGFRSDGPDSVPNLYRFDRQSRTVSRLFKSPVEQWRPAIGPSDEIYFIAGGRGNFDLFRVQSDSPQMELFESSSADEWDPAVSPDGRTVAFASRRDGTWDIFLKAADKSAPAIKLTDLAGDEWDPSFHPSGKILVYAAEAGPGARPYLYGLCLPDHVR